MQELYTIKLIICTILQGYITIGFFWNSWKINFEFLGSLGTIQQF